MTTTSTSDAEVRAKTMRYLRAQGTGADVDALRGKLAGAVRALDGVLAGVDPAGAARRAVPGEWCVQEVVDHLVETHRGVVDELRCLLAGQRPADPPIPAGLLSKAPLLRPWRGLVDELGRVHGALVDLLAPLTAATPVAVRAPVVLVVRADGAEPRIVEWVEDLDWKAYVAVSRLHLLDHVRQIRTVLAAGAA